MSGAAAAPAGARDAYPPMPREGLSLAALHAFAKKHQGYSFEATADAGADGDVAGTVTLLFEQLTTKQVVECIIKPATPTNCTYAELLLAQVCASSLRSFAHHRLRPHAAHRCPARAELC